MLFSEFRWGHADLCLKDIAEVICVRKGQYPTDFSDRIGGVEQQALRKVNLLRQQILIG